MVYVDNAEIPYGRMLMAHMWADSNEELMAMARSIGLKPVWIQRPGTDLEHFDVCKSKRVKALKAGAVKMSRRDWILKKRRAQ